MNAFNPLCDLKVIGGFEMVALYDGDGRFTHAACSCGWQWEGFPDEMLEAATLHNMTHKNVIKIKELYETGETSYDGALNFLQMVADMNEGRADELISHWQLRSTAAAS